MKNAIFLFVSVVLIISTSFAQTYVSGAVSGVWDSTGSPYYVTDSVCVPSSDSLRIGPGVEVIFQGHYKFCVDIGAVLKAIGTAEDSIIFTTVDTLTWSRGLKFDNSSPECELRYCRVSRSNHNGISCYSSNLILANSEIVSNKSIERYDYHFHHYVQGGGIYAESSSVSIDSCLIRDNISEMAYRAVAYGGGLYLIYSMIDINNSEICYNKSKGYGNYAGNEEGQVANGGGIYAEKCILNLKNTECSDNQSIGGDGGQSTDGFAQPGGDAYGGGLFIVDCILISDNIIISNNASIAGHGGPDDFSGPGPDGESYGGGIYMENSFAIYKNITLVNNNANTHGRNLYLDNYSESFFINSILWNTGGICEDVLCDNSIVGVFYSDIPYTAIVLHDASDSIWSDTNIELAPEFIDPSSGDFHLHSASPCIDAGAETVYVAYLDTTFYAPSFDIEGNSRPRGETWDIGAYESPYSSGSRPPYFVICPEDTIVPALSCVCIPFSVTDPDSDYIYISLEGPEGIFLEDDTIFTWTPTIEDTGLNEISIIITDSMYYDTCSFAIDVRGCGFPLAGAISGTLHVDDSPFCIEADVFVPPGDTLIIEPGVHLNYWGNYEFRIDSAAVLKAIGTASDSIVFDLFIEAIDPYHDGLGFYNSSPGCSLKYISLTKGHTFDRGGGIRIEGSEVSILNSNIYDNYALIDGGGVYCLESNLNLQGNTFQANHVDSLFGAALYLRYSDADVLFNRFIANKVLQGGAGILAYESKLNVINNEFIADTTRTGAAMLIWNSNGYVLGNLIRDCISTFGGTATGSSSSLTTINNVFINNYVGSGAGGIEFYNCDTSIVVNSIFVSNYSGGGSYGKGGAIYSKSSNPIISNCLFLNNSVIWDSYGGAIFCSFDSYPVIMNSIFIGNEAEIAGDEIYLAYNEDSLAYPCSLSIFNTLIDTSKCEYAEGSYIHFGDGVFYDDPMFVDTLAEDFRLMRGSPCLSAGAESVYVEYYHDSVFFAPEYDLLMNPRPNGLAPDIGPYEFFGPNSAPLIENCPFDTALTSWLDTLRYGLVISDMDDDNISLTLADTLRGAHIFDTTLYIALPEIADTGEFEVKIVACDPWACDTCAFLIYIPESIDEYYPVPRGFELFVMPNPFNSSVTILTPTSSEIEIYDVLGRSILRASTRPADKTGDILFDGKYEPGIFLWRPDNNLASGVYLVRTRFGGCVVTRRLVYLK